MNKVTSVIFRMYHTGSVGDCLLLLFQKDKVTTFSMLIDCGGWLTTSKDISACVQDIKTTCNAKIDLLIVTHQHLDHISGFNQARALFDSIEVKEVWMSWIEDSSDDIGRILKTQYGKKLKELRRITDRAIRNLKGHATILSNVKGAGERFKAKLANMEDALALIMFEQGITNNKGMAAGPTNDDAMKYLKKKGKKLTYRLPGEVVDDMKGAEGMKFFILGPPRDADMRFFKIDMKEEEMYHMAANSPMEETEMPAENQIVQSGVILEDYVSPFGAEYKMEAAERKTFNKHYNSSDNNWRQIETDWEETAASIALRVTALTNNTSLAIAIEFEDSGKVILLPADAQSGNWMSWHKPDVMKKLKDTGGKDTIDLLKNTIFYKVGHHGSHNGTASFSGLDHIPNKNLIAFMPLVQAKVPTAWGGAKNFPAKELYGVLIDKTKGRLVRTDEGIITDPRAKKLREQLSASAKKEFENSFKQGSCYVEYTIKGH